MRTILRSSALRILASLLTMAPVVACNGAESERERATLREQQEVRGTVVETNLTLCEPTPEKPGTCEGSMVLEPEGAGAAGRITIQITRDVALRKGEQTVFLPALQASEATVTYSVTAEGKNVATSVVAAK